MMDIIDKEIDSKMKKIRKEEKVCVLTGAAGVLCSSIAEDLLRHGAKVALLGRTKSKLDDLAKQLASKGLKQTIVCEADVLDIDSLKKAEKTILKKWKRIDCLVNGAGGNRSKGRLKSSRPQRYSATIQLRRFFADPLIRRLRQARYR